MKKRNVSRSTVENIRRCMLIIAAVLCVMLTGLNIEAEENVDNSEGVEVYDSGESVMQSPAAEAISSTDYGKLVDMLEDKLRNGELDDKEDVERALEKAKDQYGINISESDKKKIVNMVEVADELGIEPEKIADIVDDVYQKTGNGKNITNPEDIIDAVQDSIIDSAAEAVKKNVKVKLKNSITEYFTDFVERISDFLERFLKKWEILK